MEIKQIANKISSFLHNLVESEMKQKSCFNRIMNRKGSATLKEELYNMMELESKKVEDIDYSDCGYPLAHYERDLFLTYEKIMHDVEMYKQSRMSREEYVSAVNDYYNNVVVKDLEEVYYY